jgi:hypothetical protein
VGKFASRLRIRASQPWAVPPRHLSLPRYTTAQLCLTVGQFLGRSTGFLVVSVPFCLTGASESGRLCPGQSRLALFSLSETYFQRHRHIVAYQKTIYLIAIGCWSYRAVFSAWGLSVSGFISPPAQPRHCHVRNNI